MTDHAFAPDPEVRRVLDRASRALAAIRTENPSAQLAAVETSAAELRRLFAPSAIDELSDLAIAYGLDADAVQAAIVTGIERAEMAPPQTSAEVIRLPGVPAPGEWKDPKPLPGGLKPVKPLDLAMLPSVIVPWVEDISERMQCPPDYVGVSAVAAMGAVIGARIGIRPKRHDDWLVVPNLWGCIVGPPGYMKSPAMNDVLKPLRRMEALARREHAQAEERYAADLDAWKKRGKGKDHDTVVERPDKPVARRYVVNDTSYESLGVILADNPNGVLAFRDELMSLVKDLDKEERLQARGFFLQAWNGTDDYSFDRILRGNTYVERACISLFGSTQPGIITEYVRRVMASGGGDGMLQRFQLLVWPDGSPDWKNVDRYPIAEARTAAKALFDRLRSQEPEQLGAQTDEFCDIPFLRFDEEAQELFDAWRAGLERRLRSGELHPALESHFAKYRKLVPALALISAIADRCRRTVDAAALSGALAFADYLESHAMRVYAAGMEADVSAAKEILKRIRKGDLADGFTVRDVQNNGWSHLTVNETVKSALDLLVNNDWLAEHQIRTAGRPKQTYLINPATRAR
jgi:putative DNA primase/helicase